MKVEISPKPNITIYLDNDEAIKLSKYLELALIKDIPFNDKSFIVILLEQINIGGQLK